jgi:hypothetical protein
LVEGRVWVFSLAAAQRECRLDARIVAMRVIIPGLDVQQVGAVGNRIAGVWPKPSELMFLHNPLLSPLRQ